MQIWAGRTAAQDLMHTLSPALASCNKSAAVFWVASRHVAGTLQACCRHVAGMLQACCRHLTGMLQACCRHVAGMLQACCRHVASGISQAYLKSLPHWLQQCASSTAILSSLPACTPCTGELAGSPGMQTLVQHKSQAQVTNFSCACRYRLCRTC